MNQETPLCASFDRPFQAQDSEEGSYAFERPFAQQDPICRVPSPSQSSVCSTSSAASSIFGNSSLPQMTGGGLSQETTPITPNTALSSPPRSARDLGQGSGLLAPGPTVRKGKNRKQLSLSTDAAQQLAPSTASCTRPASTPSTLNHSNDATPMTAAPNVRRGGPPKLPQLNMAMLSLTRRPSLPVMGQGSPVGELDPGFSFVRQATPSRARRSGLTLAPLHFPSKMKDDDDGVPPTPRLRHGGDESDADVAVYTSGPVCVVHPYLWLYANPTLEQAKEYDVVINVAKEISSPLLDEAETEDAKDIIQDEKRARPMGWQRDTMKRLSENTTGPSIKPRMLAGVEYVHVPWQHNASLAQDLPTLTHYLDTCLGEQKKVLVHCQQGVSRSASLVIAYVMKSMAKDVNEAYGYVKHKSPWIGPNMTLIYQLCEWGKVLKREREQAQQQLHGDWRRHSTDYYNRHRRSLDLSKLNHFAQRSDENVGTRSSASAAASTFERSLLPRSSSDQTPASAATVSGLQSHGYLSPHDLRTPSKSAELQDDLSGARKRQRAVSSFDRTSTRTTGAVSEPATPAVGTPTVATLRDSLTSQNGPQRAPAIATSLSRRQQNKSASPGILLNDVVVATRD